MASLGRHMWGQAVARCNSYAVAEVKGARLKTLREKVAFCVSAGTDMEHIDIWIELATHLAICKAMSLDENGLNEAARQLETGVLAMMASLRGQALAVAIEALSAEQPVDGIEEKFAMRIMNKIHLFGRLATKSRLEDFESGLGQLRCVFR